MRRFGLPSGIPLAALLAFTGAAYAADQPAVDTGSNSSSGTILQAQATPPAPPPPATCGSVSDFLFAPCPLSWYGISVFGVVDMGGTWQTHATTFNPTFVTGEEYLISKNSNRSAFGLAPSGLSQSFIGIKANEEFAPGWSAIADLEAGFNPYSLRLSEGPGTVAHNAGVPMSQQASEGDSSRAGQFYNQAGYVGVSSPTYGTLTFFRQNALTLDAMSGYDPQNLSYAFSPIGYSGTTCGVGDTEDCRYSTSVKYRIYYGPFRAAALWQFGGYGLNNGSKGAYEFQAGGDIKNVAGGVISLDAVYSHVTDAVSLSLSGNTLPAQLPQVLTATISDDSSWMALAKYTHGPYRFSGGYERIDFAPPSDPQTAFTDLSGSNLCIGCAAVNNTNISNTAYSANDKILQVFWVGARYAVTDTLTLSTGYYEYLQNSFGAVACSTNAKSTCSGMFYAASFAADWQFAAKFDAYAGLEYGMVDAGLANGYLHRASMDPTVGARFRF